MATRGKRHTQDDPGTTNWRSWGIINRNAAPSSRASHTVAYRRPRRSKLSLRLRKDRGCVGAVMEIFKPRAWESEDDMVRARTSLQRRSQRARRAVRRSSPARRNISAWGIHASSDQACGGGHGHCRQGTGAVHGKPAALARFGAKSRPCRRCVGRRHLLYHPRRLRRTCEIRSKYDRVSQG